MGLIKSRAKRTRQQRLEATNQRLVDILNACGLRVEKYEKALLEYAKESNWYHIPGRETTYDLIEWVGPNNGPSLALDVLKAKSSNDAADDR